MLEKFSIGVTYERDGQLYISHSLKNAYYEIIVEEFQNEHLKLLLLPNIPLKLISVTLSYNFHFEKDSQVFANGYQSWSRSEELDKDSKLKGLGSVAKLPVVGRYASIFGDYGFKSYSAKKGIFHSWTYGYVRTDETIVLFGSLSESEGFTIFNFDTVANEIVVEKDIENFVAEKLFVLFDIVRIDDVYDKAFSQYFSKLGGRKRTDVDRYCGYTSWYNYFSHINENIILRDLEAMSSTFGDSANVFQVDDGWQSAVGDWLDVDLHKFPKGMAYIADEIHKKGYKAGLWLAPFSAQKSSKLVKEHPEWLIYDDRNMEPVLGNIGWGGAYSLNIYNPKAKEYIEKCLTVILDDWGFDMVKLDFLYSECILPRNNLTRGTIMNDAMDFLDGVVGKKLMLACGVPLGSAFGKAALCRIGSDVGLSFKQPKFMQLNREIVSTNTSMTNTIFRRGLSGNAFLCDPDVMILRKNNNTFSNQQKRALALVNWIFGDVLFVSDNVSEYDEETKQFLKTLFDKPKPEVITAEINARVANIIYIDGDKKVRLILDLATGEHTQEECHYV